MFDLFLSTAKGEVAITCYMNSCLHMLHHLYNNNNNNNYYYYFVLVLDKGYKAKYMRELQKYYNKTRKIREVLN
jgi:hypothetical protein